MFIDMRRLIHDVGSTREHARQKLFDAYGEAPDIGAMDKWVARRSAPGKWVLGLLALTEDKNPTNYLISRKKRLSECVELDLRNVPSADATRISPPESTSTQSGFLDLFG